MNPATKEVLREWIVEALKSKNGSATLLDVCKHVWHHHEGDLRSSSDLFYSWQYDIRWAATALRDRKVLKAAEISPRGVWELASEIDAKSAVHEKTA